MILVPWAMTHEGAPDVVNEAVVDRDIVHFAVSGCERGDAGASDLGVGRRATGDFQLTDLPPTLILELYGGPQGGSHVDDGQTTRAVAAKNDGLVRLSGALWVQLSVEGIAGAQQDGIAGCELFAVDPIETLPRGAG